MRISYAERRKRVRQRARSMRKARKHCKKENVMEAENFIAEFRNILRNCGLTKRQISQFSGLNFSTVDKIMRGYTKAMNVNTFIALAKAAGHSIELVPLKPREDVFRQHRRLPPPPVED